ncbi:hypothetical protein PAESOLCIP111_05462 [Paenibacillus solanacearum]|uniref:Uncharacterized protein n=1 Tax=Paenibacillus solanacearum TaxID=2048548 RepID=A0A916NLD4_9BACL|nr:hypothetical protein PAESOLCIP111_05462 [Paenibacillus solanacearum]
MGSAALASCGVFVNVHTENVSLGKHVSEPIHCGCDYKAVSASGSLLWLRIYCSSLSRTCGERPDSMQP